MVTFFDKEYKATKKIKQGGKSLLPPLRELADWINQKWGVTVLNVIYDRAKESLHAPRLQVILEFGRETKKFRDGPNFDHLKQQAIASRFVEIVSRDQNHDYDLQGLFVVFSAFAPLACDEADSKISDEEIEALKLRIGNPDLWTISRYFGYVTFMLFTDAQAQDHAAMGKKEEYAREYFQVLKPYDEFEYLDESTFEVQIDSKENFDQNYQSSWFYYDR